MFGKPQKRRWHWQQLSFVREEDIALINPMSPEQYVFLALSMPCALVAYFCSLGMKCSSVVPHQVHQFRSRISPPGL